MGGGARHVASDIITHRMPVRIDLEIDSLATQRNEPAIAVYLNKTKSKRSTP